MLPQLLCSCMSQVSTPVLPTPSSNIVRRTDLSNHEKSYLKSLASALPPSYRQPVSSKSLMASNHWTTPSFTRRAIKPRVLSWNCFLPQKEHLPNRQSVLPNFVNSSNYKTALAVQIAIAPAAAVTVNKLPGLTSQKRSALVYPPLTTSLRTWKNPALTPVMPYPPPSCVTMSSRWKIYRQA